MRFVAPGAPSTGVLITTLDSPGLMTWHEAAPLAEERLPAAPIVEMKVKFSQFPKFGPKFAYDDDDDCFYYYEQ